MSQGPRSTEVRGVELQALKWFGTKHADQRYKARLKGEDGGMYGNLKMQQTIKEREKQIAECMS